MPRLPCTPLLAVSIVIALALAGCTSQPAPLQAAAWSSLADIPAGFADGVDNDTLAGLGCAAGETPERASSGWRCAAAPEAATAYRAGTGLTLQSTTFAVDTTEIQARVDERCPAGQAIRAVLGDGNVVCQAVQVAAATAPRVAFASLASDRVLGTGCSQVLRIDLVAPAAGNVLVEASAYVIANHANSTASDQVWAYLDAAGDSCTNFIGGIHVPASAGVGLHGSTVGGRAMFHVSAAGTYAYTLRVTMASGQDAQDRAEGNEQATTLVATWFPA
ncbi:MAG TPA: hypothetical protein VGR28_13810 [Candidatus Thermoplasmatota archaeon]|jgi:hypothetical protein|nr:hypothetical protein [Candidatus Thermoplasmatota archaeon]